MLWEPKSPLSTMQGCWYNQQTQGHLPSGRQWRHNNIPEWRSTGDHVSTKASARRRWNGEMQFASIFLSLLFLLISIKGCWMFTVEERKWPLSKISTFTEWKELNLTLSHTMQTYFFTRWFWVSSTGEVWISSLPSLFFKLSKWPQGSRTTPTLVSLLPIQD